MSLCTHAVPRTTEPLRISEDLVLENHGTNSLNAGLLRAFDRLRRRLSLQVCGREGLFVGFDVLEFLQAPTGPQVRVLVTASVRGFVGTRHAVEYRAILIDDKNAGCDLARAAGWTLAPAQGSAAVPVHVPPADCVS